MSSLFSPQDSRRFTEEDTELEIVVAPLPPCCHSWAPEQGPKLLIAPKWCLEGRVYGGMGLVATRWLSG